MYFVILLLNISFSQWNMLHSKNVGPKEQPIKISVKAKRKKNQIVKRNHSKNLKKKPKKKPTCHNFKSTQLLLCMSTNTKYPIKKMKEKRT